MRKILLKLAKIKKVIGENSILYRKLFRSRGVRLVIAYFLNAHVYDVQRTVDTHRMIARENLNVVSPNLHHSQMNMVSWTETLRTGF